MDKILEEDGSAEVFTNAGRFFMSRELFEAYRSSCKPSKDRFPHRFARLLGRATVPESFAARYKTQKWYETELDEMIASLVAERGIEPRNFLSKYHESNERTSELWEIMTPEILDLITRNRVIQRFGRSHGAPIDRMTAIEHAAVGGSFGEFFGHPFMGGYSPEEHDQEEAREQRRKNVLENRSRVSLIGLVLFMNRDTYLHDNCSHYFASGARVQELDQTLARLHLGKMYDGLRVEGSPATLEGIDYVRIVLAPTQYDVDLVAIPEPVSLQFIADKRVICETTDNSLIPGFKPRKEHIPLIDTIEDEVGKTHYIKVDKVKSGHALSEVDAEPGFWFDTYHRELFVA